MSHGRPRHTEKGITMIELVVVVMIMAILAALAIPSFVQWQRNAEYRQAAQDIGSALREARSFAISMNRQHSVVINAVNRCYQFGSGDQVWNSTFQYAPKINYQWVSVAGVLQQVFTPDANNWSYLPPRITVFSNVAEIRFSPNGTATFFNPTTPLAIPASITIPAGIPAGTGAIIIRDDAGADRFGVTVTPTGRIQVSQPPIS